MNECITCPHQSLDAQNIVAHIGIVVGYFFLNLYYNYLQIYKYGHYQSQNFYKIYTKFFFFFFPFKKHSSKRH